MGSFWAQLAGYHPDGVNLIVLGDSPAEIQAAKSATKVLNGRPPGVCAVGGSWGVSHQTFGISVGFH